ncbi:MAG: type II toxin-antitoxin system Phd/YefM family antitoxin [Candidatus Niyogibacteria bacterium]|nr:type II toxin-antitoxin system Phd/YefM family antitoxin [Candidatus Niyogibacteria bacterium]
MPAYWFMPNVIAKPKIVLRGGKPKSVILDIKEYERLLGAAEEKSDLQELHRIRRGKTSFRALGEYLRERV